MAVSHGIPGSTFLFIFLLCITSNDGRPRLHDEFSIDIWAELGVMIHGLDRDELSSCAEFAPPWNNGRHLESLQLKVRGCFNSRLSRYPNSVSTIQLTRLITCGDISENPGPTQEKQSCQKCSRTIAHNHRALVCILCGLAYHIKCENTTPQEFRTIQRNNLKTWSCPRCVQQSTRGFDLNFLSNLPFGSVSDKSFRSLVGDQERPSTYNLPYRTEVCESHLTDLTRNLQNCSTKDLRVAHLNVCSLRHKIEELRCMQLTCRFEVLAITESHLDNSVQDTALDIDRMKFIRLNRKGRKGGRCILYYAEYLKATHRRDLFTEGLEEIWLQAKFPNTSVLFTIMYRPPDACHFFDLVSTPLEKTWLKSTNIFLLGDRNCDFSSQISSHGNPDPYRANTNKLQAIFDAFNMQNVVQEPTRVTTTSSTLIDLIVTTRKDLVSSMGVFPLGISDHNLIHATIWLKNKRPPPKLIKIRLQKNGCRKNSS